MTLTTKDLTAISGLLDTRLAAQEARLEAKIDAKIDTKIDAAIEQFAGIVSVGFNEVTERFNQIDTEIAELKTDVAELKTDMREVKWNLTDTVRRAEFLDLRDRVNRLEHQKTAS